jgi:hypothetical protein
MRIIHLDVRHFEYFQGVNASQSALAHGVSILMTNYVTPKSLENHRKNQEVGLLCSLFCDYILNIE